MLDGGLRLAQRNFSNRSVGKYRRRETFDFAPSIFFCFRAADGAAHETNQEPGWKRFPSARLFGWKNLIDYFRQAVYDNFTLSKKFVKENKSMRRLTAIIFLLVGCAGAVFAQNEKDAPPVSVASAYYRSGNNNVEWRKAMNNAPYSRQTNYYSIAPPPRDNPAMPPPSRDSLANDGLATFPRIEPTKTRFSPSRTQVVFTNNTARKVTAIEYLFIILDKDGNELKRHRFVNESNLKPGKTATFSDHLIGYENHLKFDFRAKIVRVKFSDGGVWQP